MKLGITLSSVSVLALLLSAPAYAQGALIGFDALDDRIEDIEEDVADDLTEGDDEERFRSNQYAQGWSGGLALGFSATTGNTDTADLSLAGRLRYGMGPWNHSFGFAAEFAEDNSVRNKEEFFATYEANRYFNDQFYVFGIGTVRYDNFGPNEWDAFLGFGPGYRVINTADQTWRVQAGPGARYIKTATGSDSTELAGLASSRYFVNLTETTFLTNDTDVLFSEEDTVVTNELGVNFKVTGNLSTRVSWRTEWDSEPGPGREDFDNTFGVSLVYGF